MRLSCGSRYSEGVADAALTVLESVRAEASRAAQLALAEARAQLAQHEALVHEASLARARCDEELQSERSQLVGLRSALQLRRIEERLRGLTLELKAAGTRLSQAQARCTEARGRVEVALQQLIDAESGRRAVAHVLGERKLEAEKRLEQREEDDASDAWQARWLTRGR